MRNIGQKFFFESNMEFFCQNLVNFVRRISFENSYKTTGNRIRTY